jgi:hypothetical protein
MRSTHFIQVGDALLAALRDEAARRERGDAAGDALAPLASALAEGDQAAISACRGAVEAAIGPEPWLCLTAFDADRIGEFVFATSRPPMVSGASRLLEQANADLAGADLPTGAAAIYSAGGGGLLVSAATAPPAALAEHVRTVFSKRTGGGLAVTAVSRAVSCAELIGAGEGGLSNTLQDLGARLRHQKDTTLPPDDVLPPAGAQRCDACNFRAAEVTWQDRQLELCRVCDQAGRRGREEIAGLDFHSIAQQAEAAGGRFGLALLAVDGNAFGDVLDRLTSLGQVRAFSAVASGAMRDARGRGLGVGSAAKGLSLLSGGDEIVAVFPAAGAFARARDLLAAVEECFVDAAAQPDAVAAFAANKAALASIAAATVGAGLVIAPPKLPVRELYRLALGLQRSAKDACFYGRPSEARRSAVDFLCVTDGSIPAPAAAGADALRPMDRSDLEAAVDASRALTAVPNSQQRALLDRCRQGREVAILHLGYQLARERSDDGPWQSWLTSCGVSPRSRDQVRDWLFPRREETRPARFPDLFEMARWSEEGA